MHRLSLILFFFCCLVTAGGLRGADEPSEPPPEPPQAFTVESPDEVEMDFDTGTITFTNGVVVKYADAVLTARRALLNEQTGEIKAEGEVRLERAGYLWTGESVEYNFITRKIIATDFKTGQIPFFVQAKSFVGDQRFGVYAGAEGMVTTDDLSVPGYRLRAKSMVILPGESLEARHATLYLGKVPVFYFPYYKVNLKSKGNRFTFTPGYRNEYGAYLLTAYNWYWNERLDGTLHLDGRSERGIGVGPDFNWHLPRFGEGTVKYYYTHDSDPGVDAYNRPIDEDRQRASLTHQGNITSNLTLKAAVRYQSDANIIHDFFETEFRKNAQPISFLELNQQWPNWSLNLLGQPQVNSFFDTVERLPDLKLDGLRQQIGATPLYYDSESSVGWFRHQFAEDWTNGYSAWRADTYHQLVLPHTFFNWLNLTPRVGGRYTHYSEADVFGTTFEDQDRGVFNTGAEASFKLSRLWTDVSSRTFALNGLRHIAEPSVNYVFVPEPNRLPTELPQFDYTVPTTRLLPIDYPDFNRIDSIDSQNVMRLSLRNRLQTKRREGLDDFLNWAVYTDWRLDPGANQGSFSDLYSELELRPFAWLLLHSDLRYDPDASQWDELNHFLTFKPGTQWSLTLGHRYLHDDYATPWFGPGYNLYLGDGYNLLYDRFVLRLTENWGFRMSHHYEIDDGRMQEQQYTLFRDFRSWTTALTFRVQDNRDEGIDYAVAFTFSLKAFPRYGQTDQAKRATGLLGY